jgi:hypothetical protein
MCVSLEVVGEVGIVRHRRAFTLLYMLSSLHCCVGFVGVQGSRCDMQLQCIAACVAATRAAAVLAGCQQVGFTFSCSSAFTKHIFGRKLARVCSQAVWISVHGAPWPTACADVCWRGGAGVNFSCCVADCLSWSLHVALGGGRRLSGWLDCGRVHAACVPGYLA